MIKKPPKTKTVQSNPISGLYKKASERVRPGGYGGGTSSLSRATEEDQKDLNPRDYLDIPLSNKPNEGDPKNNIKKTA